MQKNVQQSEGIYLKLNKVSTKVYQARKALEELYHQYRSTLDNPALQTRAKELFEIQDYIELVTATLKRQEENQPDLFNQNSES